MADNTYFERIEAIFEQVETGLEELPDDLDIRTAEGVINVTFGNGVVFVFSRQPPTEQLWLATPGGGFHYQWDDAQQIWRDTKTRVVVSIISGTTLSKYGAIRKPASRFIRYWWQS